MWCVLIACVCGKCWPGLFGVFEFLGLLLCEWGGFNLCGLLPCAGLLVTCVWCCLFCLFGVGLLAVCFV